MNKIIIYAKISLPLSLLLGCAVQVPNPAIVGQDGSFVLKKFGKPIRELALDNGYRWDYSRGPDGLNTYFVYLDLDHRVRNVEQVLTEQNFNRITSGMTANDVILMLGDPPKRHNIGRDRGYIWSYRSFSTMCIWFQIELSMDHVVRSAGYNRRPTGIPCR